VDGCIRLIRPRFAARIQFGKFRRRFREIDRAFGNPAGHLLRRGHFICPPTPSPASFDFSSSSRNSIAQIPRRFCTANHERFS
jgi:hypothetical protein